MCLLEPKFAIGRCTGTRNEAGGTLNFTTLTLAATFTALNSVRPGGIHPKPLTNNWGQRFTDWARGTIQLAFKHPSIFRGSLFLRTPSSANRRPVLLALCGSPYRSDRVRRSQRASPICKAGRATRCSIPIGCASEWTLSEGPHRRPSTLRFRSMELLLHHSPPHSHSSPRASVHLGCSAGARRRQQYPLRN